LAATQQGKLALKKKKKKKTPSSWSDPRTPTKGVFFFFRGERQNTKQLE
jgi:hypothetical protein